MGKAGNKAKTYSQKMQMASSKIRAFGNSMRYASILATGAGVASVVAFSKFEKGIANVQGLMERNDIPVYTGRLDQLQKTAVKTGFGIDDASKALFDSVSALGTGEQALSTFQTAQKLAIGGVADLSVAVDGLTSIINAYGRYTVKADDVANAFYSSQVKGKVTVAELASEIGKVAPIAQAAGVGYKELLATTAALTTGGLRADMATTALRAALSALAKPGAQARKILDRLGIAHGRTQLKAVGLKNVLWQIIEANRKYPEALDVAIPNIRAATGLFALNAEKMALIDETMKKVNRDIRNGTGLQDAYNRMLKTTDFQLKRTRGELSLIGKIIGKDLAPYVEMLGNGLEYVQERLEKLDPDIRKLVLGFGAIVAISTPVAVMLSWIVKLLGSAALLTAGKAVLAIASAFIYV